MFYAAARKDPNTFTAAMSDWRESANSEWFDGSVRSVDQRLRRCAKLVEHARQLIARKPVSEAGEYLAAVHELSADRQALAGLREDLLTGGSGREVGVSPPGRTAAAQLTSRERRWVEIEGDRFFRANLDAAHLPAELVTRARNHAAKVTSGRRRCAALTEAFAARVLDLGRATPRTRTKTASAPRIRTNFSDSMLFLG